MVTYVLYQTGAAYRATPRLSLVATKVVFTTQPSGAANGAAFTTQPVVQLQDANNQAIALAGVSITLVRSAGAATLSGTVTVATDATGKATFAGLVLTGTAGNHTLSASSGSLTGAVSNTFVLAVGAATKLAMLVQPSGAVPTVALTTQPQVRLQDQSSNNVLTASVAVAVVRHAGVVGVLSGTTPVNTDASGIAVFTDLTMSAEETGVTLDFSSSGLTGVTSAPFSVTAAGARTPLFASNWSDSLGAGATARRDGTTWDDEDGGTVSQDVMVSGGRFSSANCYRGKHQDALDYHWVQKYTVRSALSNGQFVAYRIALVHEINDGADKGGGWAGTHPVEATAIAGGGSDSSNKWALLFGSDAGSTFPFAMELTGVAFPYNYLSFGSAGGGAPASLNKSTQYVFEFKFTRSAANTYTLDIRVRNSAGTIIFSTGDSLNNIFGWGGAAFGSGHNTGLAIADGAVTKLRVGKNGGFACATAQYVYWSYVAAISDDWVGPWGSLTTDV